MGPGPRSAVITDTVRNKLIDCIISAGHAVMKVYGTDFGVETKQDKTPITEADRAADSIIRRCLENLPVPTGRGKEAVLPLLSEEGKEIPIETRSRWEAYWLVDPLDGTKEFVSRNGEFTINIALIEKKQGKQLSGPEFLPTAGFVYLPVLQTLYWGIDGTGSFRLQLPEEGRGPLEEAVRLPVPRESGFKRKLRIVASRSHLDPKTKGFIDTIGAGESKNLELVQAGSSLKLCRIAEGSADLYPRFGPTMEWDIAAGHGVCRAAGYTVFDLERGSELQYNKPVLKNGHFLAGKPETVKKYIPAGR